MASCKTCRGRGFVGLGSKTTPRQDRKKYIKTTKGTIPCPDCKTPDRRRPLLETTEWFKNNMKPIPEWDLRYNNEHQGDVAESYAQFWFEKQGCTVGRESGNHDYDRVLTFPNGKRVFIDIKYLGLKSNNKKATCGRVLTPLQKLLGVKLVYVNHNYTELTMPSSYADCGLDYTISAKNRTGHRQTQAVISEVKKLRNRHDWSAYAIGKKLGLARQTIIKILKQEGMEALAVHVKEGIRKHPFGHGNRTKPHLWNRNTKKKTRRKIK